MTSNNWYAKHLRKELDILCTCNKIFEIFFMVSFLSTIAVLFFQKYLLITLPSLCVYFSNKQKTLYKQRIYECIDTLCCLETHPDVVDYEVKYRAKKILFS